MMVLVVVMKVKVVRFMALAILVMSAMLAWVMVVVLLVVSECCLL